MTTSPTVQRVTAEALRRLRKAGDPARRAGMGRYFKAYENVSFFGVTMGQVRAIGKEIAAAAGNSWGYRDALAVCQHLVERRELEGKLLGLLVLGRHEERFPKGLLTEVRRWLAGDHLATWAAVDTCGPVIVTPLIVHYPDLGDRVMAWTRARSLWVRRMAPVAFIPLVRHGLRLRDGYRIAEALLGDEEDLMHKATGWMLREAGKTDMARLERFLMKHGPRIPRTTVRYAIERYPAAKRRQLLEATR